MDSLLTPTFQTVLLLIKLGSVLKSGAAEDRDSILVDIQSSLTSQDLADIVITPSMVADAMSCLKRFKSDGTPGPWLL